MLHVSKSIVYFEVNYVYQWVTGSDIETPDGLLQVGKNFKIGTG